MQRRYGPDPSDGADDMQQWADDALVAALRAPGTPTELSGQDRAVAAYRAARPHPTVRRLVSRLGVGGTAMVATVALSTGAAAAAYTQSLPAPVQDLAHGVLAGVGVPAAPKPGPKAEPKAAAKVSAQPVPVTKVAPPPSPAPTPTPETAPGPQRREDRRSSDGREQGSAPKTPAPVDSTPVGRPGQVEPSPTAAPTTSPTATPSAEPTVPAAPVRVPASVTIQPATSRVPVGSGVSVSGVVRSEDGHLLRGRTVRLRSRIPGQATWTRVAVGRTDTDGMVTLYVPDLQATTWFKLRTRNGVVSPATRVVVVPSVHADAATQDTVTQLLVSTVGGRAGDVVTALRRRDGHWVRMATGSLDASGAAELVVRTPQFREVRFVVRLRGTKLHATASTTVRVSPVS